MRIQQTDQIATWMIDSSDDEETNFLVRAGTSRARGEDEGHRIVQWCRDDAISGSNGLDTREASYDDALTPDWHQLGARCAKRRRREVIACPSAGRSHSALP